MTTNLPLERTQLQLRAFRWLALAVFALTALQPVLGAFGFFRVSTVLPFTNMHEMIGHFLGALTVLLFGLTVFSQLRHRRLVTGLTAALLLTTFTQIGLGYLARDDASRLGFHVPLGVAIFALALILTLVAFGIRFDRDSRP